MKWANPITPASITGKQTLTGDQPITNLHRAVEELQNDVVAGASVKINDTLLSVSVSGNKLFISGTIEVPAGDLSGEAESDFDPYLTLEINDGVLTLSGDGFDGVYAPLSHDHQYAPITHYHPNYALGGEDNPSEFPESATLNHVLTWNGSAWVAGPVRAL